MKKIILLLALVACTKDEKPTTKAPDLTPLPAPATGTKTTNLGPGKQRIEGQNFALDLASADCKAGADCTLAIKLIAASGFHVNKEYPYKLTANAAPGVTFLGKKDANTFTKESGDFVEEGETTGTMTVRFKPAAAGDAKVAGTYKMSICSADQCQIEAQPITLNVPVN